MPKNETVICAANCVFQSMNLSGATSGDSDSAIVIGPDATTVTGLTPAVLSLRQGSFDPASTSSYEDIRFDQSPVGDYCNNCAVTLVPDFLDLYAGTPSGTPSTNLPANVVGTTGYAPPLFANAGIAGAPPPSSQQPVPLSLTPNELGIIATTSGTAAAPGTYGLKLRVECDGTGTHNVRLVVLAGTSGTETVLASGLGAGSISTCP